MIDDNKKELGLHDESHRDKFTQDVDEMIWAELPPPRDEWQPDQIRIINSHGIEVS